MTIEEAKERLRKSWLGKTHTEEVKKKMSERMMGNTYRKGVKKSKETIEKVVAKLSKKVINIDTGDIFSSIVEASRQNNIKCKGNICLVCRGYRKTAGGFRWSYFEDNK